jgi:hypothetical protein
MGTFATLLSGSCCVLPVVLVYLGVGSLGPLAVLMPYRPWTLTFSLVILGTAFYLAYRPQAARACEAGLCSPQALRRQRRILWVAAGLMAVFVGISFLPLRMSM